MTDISPIKAIFGTGRSGTTWLGSIVNSHPDIVYSFEPFHRLKKSNQQIVDYLKLMEKSNFSDQDIPQIYNSLIQAHPLTDKPPFFRKSSSPLFGKQWMWLLARYLPVFIKAFQILYTAKNAPPLIFKEINYEKYMARILTCTSIPVVYLVRHPCAVVMSDIKGQIAGKMPQKRKTILNSLLYDHDPSLFADFESRLDQLTNVEKTALLWRIDIEKAIKIIQSSEKGLLVAYEKVCDDPYQYSQIIFKHFNLNYSQETTKFLDQLTSINENYHSQPNFSLSKDWMNKYFTVYKNPQQQKNLWKSQIRVEDRKQIEAIVKNSPAFDICASLGGWD